MGIMTRMRDNAHIFIISFAVVFILFWVISDVDVSSWLQGSANEVGEIGGKVISYQEFSSVVERVMEQQKKQNKDKDLDENQIASIREQVWNDYITQAVIEKAVKDIGVVVTDQEIYSWVRGPNPPEILTQHFKDSTGKFRRDLYDQFLTDPRPENEQALVQIEQQLRSDLLRQKLTTTLIASFQIGDGELLENFKALNQQYNAKYILFDPRKFAAADTSYPTQIEFEEYYNKHKNEFRNEEMRMLQYVSFVEAPTTEDTAAIKNELELLAKDARGGKDFLQMIKEYSDQPYEEHWFNHMEIMPEHANLVFTQPVGSVIGPMHDQNGIALLKILETREGKETFTKAHHILIKSTAPDDAKAKQKAESIIARIHSGEKFEELAKKFSEDPGSAARGGDLGWYGKGRMVKPFEEAASKAKIGQVIAPIKSEFGYHIIRVDERSNREVKYATLRMTIKPSSRTKDAAYEKARNFAYFASENGFEKEAQDSKSDIRETGEFQKQKGSYIPEIGVNPSLMKFAFEGKVGDMSEVHKSMNGYVVTKIAAIVPAGFRPLERVSRQIVEQVKNERRLKKVMDAAKSYYAKLKPGQGLESILPPDSSLKVVTTGPFTINQGMPIIGRDVKVLGRISALKQGEISKPFKGEHGVFIAQLLSTTSFDTNAFKLKKDELRNQQLQQKQNEYLQAWLEKMKEDITIVDNRDRFFR